MRTKKIELNAKEPEKRLLTNTIPKSILVNHSAITIKLELLRESCGHPRIIDLRIAVDVLDNFGLVDPIQLSGSASHLLRLNVARPCQTCDPLRDSTFLRFTAIQSGQLFERSNLVHRLAVRMAEPDYVTLIFS